MGVKKSSYLPVKYVCRKEKQDENGNTTNVVIEIIYMTHPKGQN
jgi:hypothetical protein